MPFDLATGAQRILEGESMIQLAEAYRHSLIDEMGLGEEDVTAQTFRREAFAFTQKLCRHLGDRHHGDGRVGSALQAWCQLVEDYDAWDVLLSGGFAFDGRPAMLRRGRVLFPGALTAHWPEDPAEGYGGWT